MYGDFKLLLLLAMKPGCGQQLSRRVGNHRWHITHPTQEIRTKLDEAYATTQPKDKVQKSKTYNTSLRHGSPRASSRGADISFKVDGRNTWPMHKRYRDTYIRPLTVERAKQSNIPGSVGFFVGFVHLALLWFLSINKIIYVVV